MMICDKKCEIIAKSQGLLSLFYKNAYLRKPNFIKSCNSYKIQFI